MRYQNTVCPGCGKPFTEDDDIVVCPDCATPQHRECYDKLHSCVNGYLHASGFVWQESETAESPEDSRDPWEEGRGSDNAGQKGIYCPNCGVLNEPGSFHCANCGEPMPIQTNAVPPFGGMPFGTQFPDTFAQSLGISEADMIGEEKAINYAIYVKKRVPRFLKKFHAFSEEEGKRISWNWAAFFLTPYYLFYRRMAKVGFLFMSIFVALSLILTPTIDKNMTEYLNVAEEAYSSGISAAQLDEETLNHLNEVMVKCAGNCAKDPIFIVCVAVNLFTRICAALLADFLYFRKVKKDIAIVRERIPEENMLRATLVRVGGVSVLSFLSSYFVYSAAAELLMMLAERIAR